MRGSVAVSSSRSAARPRSFDWRRHLSALLWESNRDCALLSGAVAVLAFVPRVLTIGHFETNDEVVWMSRSESFSDAILHLHPSKASATTKLLATMPGVTTMWLGTAARIVWRFGTLFGLISNRRPFETSAAGLMLAQLAVAIATSLLLGLFVRLTWRWAGPIAAVVGGLIMATEPFFVAHGSVIHVDELTALFGITGTVAFLLALDVPRAVAEPSRRMSVLAGLLLASAFLTKVSAFSFAPGLLLVTLVVGFSRPVDRAGWPPWLAGAAETWRRLWPGLLAGVVLILAAWPALWADPGHQLHLLRLSAQQADQQHVTFFLGHETATPGLGFYFVAVPFRMTPWFLLGSVGLGGFALWSAPRARLLALLALPQAAILSLAAKQFDRYALSILAILALIVGIGADAAWLRLRPRLGRASRVHTRQAGVAFALLMFVNTVVVAPWGLAYFDPLLGGSSTAQRALLVGWGEGLEKAGAIIKAREAPACNVSIAVYYLKLPNAFPCGHTVARDAPAPYLIVYINDRQRVAPGSLVKMRARGQLIATVRIRGIDYAEVYDTRLH